MYCFSFNKYRFIDNGYLLFFIQKFRLSSFFICLMGITFMIVEKTLRSKIIKEAKMKIISVAKNLEELILGSKKPKDHWKKYRVPRNSK